ncbi:MAG TPA: PP2C family protein-serine/threonine phosphatase [Candidatus Eremiobacteraceae bacterium]|nr:PP2C family protein-serine/threonine phosphatase [Candidatus Eremiobacteraceae bacterium]
MRFSAVNVPAACCGLTGGDWYDVIPISDRRLVVSIGDVAGHNVESAVVMTRVKRSIRTLAKEVASPRLLLHRLNATLCEDAFRGFVTTFLGYLDLEARTLTYSNAGHPPPIVRRSDGTVTMFDTGDAPLGLKSSDLRVESTIALDSGSLLVLYTDGLTEVRRNVILGERMVCEAVQSGVVAHADDPADALRQRVVPHGSHDDVAILTVMLM